MVNDIEENSILIENNQIIRELFGDLDENVKLIEEKLNIRISIKNNEIRLSGEKELIDLGEKLIHHLIKIVKQQKTLDKQDIEYILNILLKNQDIKLNDLLNDVVSTTSSGKKIRPKTLGQKRYLDSIKTNDIVFGIGPAGTGKTYLAIAMAIHALKNKQVNKIILARPAVEAGENLGFLPGDLQEKVDPYLRPIYDALFDILGTESYIRYMERGIIEVAPLAYMRGRTLDSSYVILDEAQNTTNEQMKMFLTRLGFGSKAIITGDITQIDLPRGKKSGLKDIVKVLDSVKGIDFIYLSKNDVVRHHLVQRIIEAYEKYENTKA